jgi:hypothetical protein
MTASCENWIVVITKPFFCTDRSHLALRMAFSQENGFHRVNMLLDEQSSPSYTQSIKYVMPPPTGIFSSPYNWRYALMSSEREGSSSKETHNSRNAYKETSFVGVLHHPITEQPGSSHRLSCLFVFHAPPSLYQALTYLSHKTHTHLAAGPVIYPWCT